LGTVSKYRYFPKEQQRSSPCIIFYAFSLSSYISISMLTGYPSTQKGTTYKGRVIIYVPGGPENGKIVAQKKQIICSYYFIIVFNTVLNRPLLKIIARKVQPPKIPTRKVWPPRFIRKKFDTENEKKIK